MSQADRNQTPISLSEAKTIRLNLQACFLFSTDRSPDSEQQTRIGRICSSTAELKHIKWNSKLLYWEIITERFNLIKTFDE